MMIMIAHYPNSSSLTLPILSKWPRETSNRCLVSSILKLHWKIPKFLSRSGKRRYKICFTIGKRLQKAGSSSLENSSFQEVSEGVSRPPTYSSPKLAADMATTVNEVWVTQEAGSHGWDTADVFGKESWPYPLLTCLFWEPRLTN